MSLCNNNSSVIAKGAFTATRRKATVEVYQANHGWYVKGGAVYNEAEAERAWTALDRLYKASLD